LFERLTERQSALRLFTYSPSVQALDFAARSFPIFAPEPKLTDPAPRMSAMLPPVQARVARSVLWWPVSLGMMLSVVVLTRPRVCRSVAEASASAAAHAAATVSVRNLTKRYGAHTAADDVSFTVARGETVALWGANGAGKTTILRCLLGIAQFDGVVRVLGLQGKEARRQIGYVPQDVRLHGDLTVRETLRFYAELRKVAPSEKLLEQWRLLDVADKPVRALSGGMRQRLAVAIALLSDPPVMLLDEPTSNLDRQSRAELRALLQQLKATGKTLIVSLHRAEEVRQLADRVIVLECGRKIAEGAPNGLADFLIESEEEVA
jgi:ABC-type multidrug transport system ATPase subunit